MNRSSNAHAIAIDPKVAMVGQFRMLFVAIAGALLAWALAISPVAAHVDFESSDPAADATVLVSPDEVRVVFTGEISDQSTLSLSGPDGSPVDTGDAALDLDDLDRRSLVLTLPDALASGEYTVAYSGVPVDGHEQAVGTFAFILDLGDLDAATPAATLVGTPDATPVATPASTPEANAAGNISTGDGDGSSSMTLVVVLIGGMLMMTMLSRRRLAMRTASRA